MISESTLLVRPEHLNHHGFLFGGRLLEWLDEQAYIAAISHLKPEANLVTVAIDRVEFEFSVVQGSLLRFRSLPVHLGTTSLTVFTQVLRRHTETGKVPPSGSSLGAGAEKWGEEIFRAYVSFVCLDEYAQPRPVAPLLLQPFSRKSLSSKEERLHWDEVERARRRRAAQHP